MSVQVGSPENSGWRTPQEVSSPGSAIKRDHVVQGFLQVGFENLQGYCTTSGHP